jgi:hypothetical protein
MTTITQFIRTTVVGGLFFLAPFVVLIVIIAKAFDFAKKTPKRASCAHSSRFGLNRWGGDGAGGRIDRSRLLCCRTPRSERPGEAHG